MELDPAGGYSLVHLARNRKISRAESAPLFLHRAQVMSSSISRASRSLPPPPRGPQGPDTTGASGSGHAEAAGGAGDHAVPTANQATTLNSAEKIRVQAILEAAFKGRAGRPDPEVLGNFKDAFDELSSLDTKNVEVQDGISELMFACCGKATQNPHFLALVAAQRSIPANPRLHEALSDAVLRSGKVALTARCSDGSAIGALHMRSAAVVLKAAATIHRKVPEATRVLIGGHVGVLISSAAQPEGAIWQGGCGNVDLDSCLMAARIVAPTRLRNSVLLDVVRANLNAGMQSVRECDMSALHQLAEGIDLGADDARQLAARLMQIYKEFPKAIVTDRARLLYSIAQTCDRAHLHEVVPDVARELRTLATQLDGASRWRCYTEAFKIDPSSRLASFSCLLEQVSAEWKPMYSRELHVIAVVSFQMDPDGQDALEIEGARSIPYPPWLVDLRARLKAYWYATAHPAPTDTGRSQSVRDVMASNADAMQPEAPYDLSKLLSGPLANLMNDYDSPPVTPAHWPALFGVLQRANLSRAVGITSMRPPLPP